MNNEIDISGAIAHYAQTEEHTCCICGKTFYGPGNNPYPVKEEGECCDACQWDVVLKERFRLSKVTL